ncbi:MAG: FAD-binding oxidoreductase [Pyrinomonadaceae bacterium]
MDTIIEELRAIVGRAAVLSEPDELLVYECDGLPQHKYRPGAVVFPSSTEETSEVMRVLAHHGVPFTPRGAGTGLSGGAVALNQGVVIELARMRKILSIDETNRVAVVQAGVVNLHVSRAVAHLDLHYVPDPSSQPTCTIGGNVAENAGGIHCLKYGTTTDHVLGLRVVLAGGEVVDLGGAGAEVPGYDLLGVFIGSEGTFGIATEATLRLVPIPPAVRTLLAEFKEVNDASHAVSAIIAAGVMPAALEMMDREIIRAVEASVFAAGLPLDAGAALLIELDGIEAGIDDEADYVKSICLKHGARDCRLARDENERKKLWAARKGAFGAIGRISPDSMIQDAVVPRSRLPEVLDAAYRIASKYQLRIANVFHAGDGNLHPLICFDSRSSDEVHRVKEAGRELMETCVRAGGSITGEHGVGFDKRDLLSLIFSDNDMDAMLRVRAAFDPAGLCNPDKIIPLLRGCGEARATGNGPSTREEKPTTPGAELAALASDSTAARMTTKLYDSHLPRKGRSLFAPLSTEATKPPYRNWQQGRSVSGDLAKRVAAVVGDANVLPSPLPEAAGAVVIYPGSIPELCEVIKFASSEGWGVVPAGAMTWVTTGNCLTQVNLIISTAQLNSIVEHEPADLITVAQAGVTLDHLNSQLKLKGQWLPLDPPDDGRATIGGVVATGLGGPHQFGYGPPRRHVIGMRVVLADGSLIKVGGRVVKNVAGYDLCKLFTGSYGTLGVVVEINFKLRPTPVGTATLIASGECGNLISIGKQLIDSRLFPVAVELLSPGMARETQLSDAKQHALLIRFAGSPNGVTSQANRGVALVNDNIASGSTQLVSEDSVIWRTLAALPLRFQEDIALRVGLRPANVGTFLFELDEARTPDSAQIMWQAGIGDGRIRVLERRQHKDDETEAFQNETIARVDELRRKAETLGGTLIIEHAPPRMKAGCNAWGTFGSSASLMRRVKQNLDPDKIFSPGRFGF